MQWRHFSPRVGFAYQLNNKTVVLSGLSFSFLNAGASEYGTSQVAVNFGNQLDGTFSVDSSGQIPGLGQWDTTPLPSPPKPVLGTDSFILSPNEIHRHIDQSYSELLTIGVQRELPWKMFTSVSYVHNHDLHLPAALIRRNQLDPKIPALCPDGLLREIDCVIAQLWTTDVAQALLKDLGFGQFQGLYTPYENYLNQWGAGRPLVRVLVPYPQFRYISNPFDTTGAAKYDALQVSFQKRTGSGLTLLAA